METKLIVVCVVIKKSIEKVKPFIIRNVKLLPLENVTF